MDTNTETTQKDPTFTEFMELYSQLTPEERVGIRAKIARMAWHNLAVQSANSRDMTKRRKQAAVEVQRLQAQKSEQ